MIKLPDTLDLPTYVPIIFGLTALFTLIQFYRILRQSKGFSRSTNWIIGGLMVWILLQSFLAYTGFYQINPMSTPPRFLLAFLPILLFTLWVFVSQKGKRFVDTLPLLPITWLNVVRIPVEFCLYWLFLGKAVPELMTFTGRNFDIIAGVTAPFIAYFGLQKKQFGKTLLLVWNCLSLGLLVFIIFNGVLSAPTILQQFAFEQPNIALIYFPYILLPSLIVPVVLFGHFVSIRRLTK